MKWNVCQAAMVLAQQGASYGNPAPKGAWYHLWKQLFQEWLLEFEEEIRDSLRGKTNEAL